MNPMPYCESIYQTKRFPTREVKVGSLGVGGNNPIRLQSMTTSNTRDVEATVDQILKLKDCGCEMVRMTVQGKKEAEATGLIKNRLLQLNCDIPLVADIHFYPPAALLVAEFVDKVRINPGNFKDKRASFQVIEYTDAEYQEELDQIEEAFTPLVEKCKRLNRALRIGTNHGSLSDRIMNRFGDTPYGMVESALEYARIAVKNDFHSLIFSMKASNPKVMVQAYRLLVKEMKRLNWNYPLHLGVTEAGEGEDGWVKSAMGIGSLLIDGLGDTIRVSLTEDPWFEIDPCRRLANLAQSLQGKGAAFFEETSRDPFAFKKRMTKSIFDKEALFGVEVASPLDLTQKLVSLKNKAKSLSSPDFILPKGQEVNFEPNLKEAGIRWISNQDIELKLPSDLKEEKNPLQVIKPFGVLIKEDGYWEKLLSSKMPSFILWQPSEEGRVQKTRRFYEWLSQKNLPIPLYLYFDYTNCKSFEDVIIQASAECGSLLMDGIGEGIILSGPYEAKSFKELSLSILQAARLRSHKTEFISCPGCGRTLFNLQQVTEKIRSLTGHLPGVKIAVMGCIVNGPGEMADADFGYVGSKTGMIDLYIGKECVEKNIEETLAPQKLVDLIKSQGKWVEPALV